MIKTIFVVDDNNVNLLTAEETLSPQYNVYTLSSAKVMFELLENITPELILLDIVMPEMSGFEALKMLKDDERYAEIPVIFLTSKRDSVTEAAGFEMGVVDYMSKPFSEPVLLNRIKTHLHIEDIIKERTTQLRDRTDKLLRLQNSMVSVLANMVENRDKLTGRHTERTTNYIKILLGAMIEHGVYEDQIKEWDMDVVVSSARLHDIGKIVVTDLILNKPDKLTDEEMEIMRTHAAEGEKIIDTIIDDTGDEDFLFNAKLFAGTHHEKWDGTGYPCKLKGDSIPLQGRIMAIADVYDALVSDRPYKAAFSHEKAVDIIVTSGGTHFDPKLAEVFLKVNGLFEKVSAAR